MNTHQQSSGELSNVQAGEQLQPVTEITAFPEILLIEDSHPTRKLARRFFERHQLTVHDVSTGDEALDYLTNHKPLLICSDINMPGISGLDLCKAVRQNEETKDIPFIIFTALSSNSPIEDAFSAGANDYVIKPFRESELVSRAKWHIDAQRRRLEDGERIKRLNYLNETKNRFLSVASHDLRNPIVSIRGISQFLKSGRFGELNESQAEMVSTIAETSEFMLSLVEDLLDISKIEAQRFEMSLEPVCLSEIVSQAFRLHQPTAQKKHIQLTFNDLSHHASALLDRRLMTRVLDNLISNAIKFTFPNTEAQINLHAGENNISVIVEDQGPGIPENEFDRLFKEFSRTSTQPTGGESSSGIGLFVVKRIAQQHSADITAENRPTGGARFTFKIPRYQS